MPLVFRAASKIPVEVQRGGYTPELIILKKQSVPARIIFAIMRSLSLPRSDCFPDFWGACGTCLWAEKGM